MTAARLYAFSILLTSSVCHAAPPTDRDLLRFLRAYPVGDLFEAGFRASVLSISAQSATNQKAATCALRNFDKRVIEAAALVEAHDQFRDASTVTAITKILESTAGKKMVGSLFRVAQGPNRVPLFPAAPYTSEEENELGLFQRTPAFAAFQTYAQTVGPQVEKSSAYLAMMSNIKVTCIK